MGLCRVGKPLTTDEIRSLRRLDGQLLAEAGSPAPHVHCGRSRDAGRAMTGRQGGAAQSEPLRIFI